MENFVVSLVATMSDVRSSLITLSTAGANVLNELPVDLMPLRETVVHSTASRDMLRDKVAKHLRESFVHQLVHPIPVNMLEVLLVDNLFQLKQGRSSVIPPPAVN